MNRSTIKIGNRTIAARNSCYIIAEIGINHNGSLDLAKQMIKVAVDCGCDAVKFQKRTIDVVYSAEELSRPRESVFGSTNGDLKRGLEFGFDEYSEIDKYCKELGVDWTASCWDEASVDFLEQFKPPFYKISSASLTDDNLLKHHRKLGRPIMLSTGMSTMQQIDHAFDILGNKDLAILHCTSTYPAKMEELNLKVIQTLMDRFPLPIGYSGHEATFIPTYTAAMMGACVIERHITVDRAMWGSDQVASLEPVAFNRMVKYIREIDTISGDGVKQVYESELPIIDKLRRK